MPQKAGESLRQWIERIERTARGAMGLASGASASLLETRVDASVSGTYDIDWTNGIGAYRLTMTADTTFSDINLPEGADTKVMEIIIDGNFIPTFPVTWEGEPGNDAYNGAVRNRILVSCLQGDAGSEDIIYTLTNLAT